MGKKVYNAELKQLYDYDYEFDKKTKPIIQPINYQFKDSPFTGPYITYQFDKSWEQRTWCREHIFTNREIQAIYNHYKSQDYKMIDIGHNHYNLKQTADIINGSHGHIGLCSGMGWFALACGKKPIIWYATDDECKHLKGFKLWWLHNGASIKYFDEEFETIDCKISVDGTKFNYISR